MNKPLIVTVLLGLFGLSSANLPTYKYEVDIKFRSKDSPSIFEEPNLVVATKNGLWIEVPLLNNGQAKKKHNVSVIDIPAKIEDIANITFGWTTPSELDDISMGIIRLRLTAKYADRSLKDRYFYGDLYLVSQPQFKQSKVLCEERKQCPHYNDVDVYNFEVDVKYVQSSSSPGRASLLLDTSKGQMNVTLSKSAQSVKSGSTKKYSVRLSVTNEEIRRISFVWKSSGSVEKVELTLKPDYDESKPWRRFSVSQVSPNVPKVMTDDEPAYKYVAVVQYLPVKSENSLGQPSLALKTNDGRKLNITLTTKRVWMNQTRTNIYEFYAATKLEHVSGVTLGWTTPSRTARHVSVELILKLAFESEPKPRKFSGDKIGADQPQKLSELKEDFSYPVTNLRVNVTFQRPYSSKAVGKMSLLLIPDNVANAVNVTLSKVDENLNHDPFNVYNAQIPLFLEEIKRANFTWTTTETFGDHEIRPRLMAYIYIETVPSWGSVRTFYLGGSYPNEVESLWGGKKKN